MKAQSAYGADNWFFTSEQAILMRAKDLAKPGEWVEAFDMMAIADILNLQIVLSHPTNTQVFRPKPPLNDRLRTVGIAHLGEKHYMPIVPLAANWFEDQEKSREPTHTADERHKVWTTFRNSYIPAFLRDYEQFMNSDKRVIPAD